MRPEETAAADATVRYVKSRLPDSVVSSRPGEDPPDFLLSVDNATFPLEVTSTEAWQQPTLGAGQVRERTFHSSHRRLLRDIQDRAAKSQRLQGKYAVSFSAPLSVENFRATKSAFAEALASILDASKDEPMGFDQEILLADQSVAWVFKLSTDGERLYEAFEDGAWTESPEFLALVSSMLSRAIERKRMKLSPSTLRDSILVIYNTYGLADRQTLRDASKPLASIMAAFHSVFVFDNGSILPLHSLNPDWLLGDA